MSTSRFSRRVEIYALALLDDTTVSVELPMACGELAAHLVDRLNAKASTREDARNVETILSRECGVSL